MEILKSGMILGHNYFLVEVNMSIESTLYIISAALIVFIFIIIGNSSYAAIPGMKPTYQVMIKEYDCRENHICASKVLQTKEQKGENSFDLK